MRNFYGGRGYIVSDINIGITVEYKRIKYRKKLILPKSSYEIRNSFKIKNTTQQNTLSLKNKIKLMGKSTQNNPHIH